MEEGAMDLFMIVFRLVHIIAAIVWVGGTVLFFFYIEPTITKLGPDAEKFVDEFINRRKVPVFFAAASTIAVVGGLILYYRDAGGFQLWTTGAGPVFTIGAVAGILAWIGGAALVAPGVKKVAAIGAEMKAAGGPPSRELIARMGAAQHRLRQIGMWDLVLVIIAVVCMEAGRYTV
jgi:uncharacterized membrane protein